MALSQTTCQTNPQLAIAYVDGKPVACWGADEDGSLWLMVNGRNHHITTQQLTENAKRYNILNAGIPWQTIVEINRAYATPAPAYTPPSNTYYYGPNGEYVGRSTTW